MKTPALDFADEELSDLALIKLLIDTARARPIKDLHILMSGEIRRLQPGLPDILRHLYRMNKFTEQFEDLMRVVVIIWWYYQPILPPRHSLIDETLYISMEKKHGIWADSFKGQTQEANKKKWERCLSEHPSGCLLRVIHGIFIGEPYGTFKKLSRESRAFLFYKMKVILDCFEELKARDR